MKDRLVVQAHAASSSMPPLCRLGSACGKVRGRVRGRRLQKRRGWAPPLQQWSPGGWMKENMEQGMQGLRRGGRRFVKSVSTKFHPAALDQDGAPSPPQPPTPNHPLSQVPSLPPNLPSTSTPNRFSTCAHACAPTPHTPTHTHTLTPAWAGAPRCRLRACLPATAAVQCAPPPAAPPGGVTGRACGALAPPARPPRHLTPRRAARGGMPPAAAAAAQH